MLLNPLVNQSLQLLGWECQGGYNELNMQHEWKKQKYSKTQLIQNLRDQKKSCLNYKEPL
jgi:hypothetical protein